MSIISRAVSWIVLLSSAPCFAQSGFTYFYDGRRCSAQFSGNGSGSTYEVPQTPFGPYAGGASIEADNGIELWRASCSQTSSLNATHMTMTAGATAFVTGQSQRTLSAQATALFDLRFSCTAQTPYRLVGLLTESGHPNSFGDVRLTTAAGDVIHAVTSSEGASTPFVFDGTLAPGNYIMVARAQSRAINTPGASGQGDAACSFSLSAAGPGGCPLDWNGDAIVNSADFLMFLIDFLSGDADYNADGVTSSEDFFGFFGDFLNGC